MTKITAEVFFWPIRMSLTQLNFLLVYSHLFNFECKYIKPYMSTAVKEINLKAIFALMNTTQAVVKIRPEKNSGLYGIWTHDLCDTSLTSQLGAGPQFIETIFINLQLFILPLTGLFGINIMTSSQLAYTTVRLSAFNYRCLQLTRLVQRRSLQNNAYGYLTECQR